MMLNPSDSRQLPLRTKKPPKSVKQVKDSCKRARPINREQKQIFQEWLTEHSNHLYPNEEDKKELAVKMDANPQQINRLLTKYRQRINQEIQENQLKYKADVAVVKHEKVAINNIISEIVKDVALDNRDQRRIYEERKAKYMLYLKENNMLDEDDDDLQVIWEGKHVATDLNVRNDSNDSPGQQKEVSTTTDNENNNANFKNMENQSNTDQAVSTQPENCDLANKNNIPVERSLQDNTELLPQKDIEVAEVVEIAEVASRDQSKPEPEFVPEREPECEPERKRCACACACACA
ncbi:unnamed protein product [Bursaphelenchus okinawaensis]|uniref:KN homeodomain domain-containing protein n=1 Tax=Bursaphelenchus okinawaensis TaxID=465554 RepID=A0A811JPZ3_9BILA|nr:unnamed protein product [Bursaphelenchus okinawaensis]CAG9077025.1 unnamed protein product [Bursaphelenchus okinawaensis]